MDQPRISAEEQLEADSQTLQAVSEGLDRLEREWLDVRQLVQARSRGYFTPDEEDAVRRILLSYRNYRIALYDLIHRSISYSHIREEESQVQVFMIGFAAALTLYAKSLKLIQTYEREPLVRAKLNEPDEKFGLGSGFFEEVLAAYSSPWNYWLLLKATVFWRTHRRAVKQLQGPAAIRAQWLAGTIQKQRKIIPKRLLAVLRQRARYDLRLFVNTALNPFRRSTYALKRTLGTAFAGARLSLRYKPAITSEVTRELRARLRPGDILLLRADEKLTATILPGFWSHAAIYLGTPEEQQEKESKSSSQLQSKTAPKWADGYVDGEVIEAVSPRLVINPLEKSLFGDHVLALRPNLAPDLIADALREARLHLGKPYDFEFDFNISNRIVCTELVYRAFHKKGSIAFSLVKRLGRFTLTGNDIVHHALDTLKKGHPEFIPVALYLKCGKHACFIPEEKIVGALEHIRAGRRPDALELNVPATLPPVYLAQD